MVISDPGRRNRRLLLICLGVFAGMGGLAFASVPLYRAFCQATGFDGTIVRAKAAPGKVLDRTIDVRFDANVRDLPWTFKPSQVSQTVRLGATGLAYYTVTNNGAEPITGQAVYNVVPEQAGAFFRKIECFCFTEQTVQPGQTVEFPVVYFVDPEYAQSRDTAARSEVTLSYTFFPVQESASAKVAQASGEAGRAGL